MYGADSRGKTWRGKERTSRRRGQRLQGKLPKFRLKGDAPQRVDIETTRRARRRGFCTESKIQLHGALTYQRDSTVFLFDDKKRSELRPTLTPSNWRFCRCQAVIAAIPRQRYNTEDRPHAFSRIIVCMRSNSCRMSSTTARLRASDTGHSVSICL